MIREFRSRDLESQRGSNNRERVTGLGALTSLKKPETMSPAASFPDRLSKEIETYVFFPVVDGDDDSLCWWKLNDHKLPMLGQLARQYLAIQATSSPKLFSKAGQVSTSANAQLKPEKVDQLVFLTENLWNVSKF